MGEKRENLATIIKTYKIKITNFCDDVVMSYMIMSGGDVSLDAPDVRYFKIKW